MTDFRRQLTRLAVPMATAQLLAIMVPIIIVAMLGWMDERAIQLRSLYFPLAFLFFAVQMAFDVTGQTVTARRSGRGEHDVAATVLTVGALWLVAGVVLGGGLSLGASALGDVLGTSEQYKGDFARFLREMSLANLTLAWPVVCSSVLRGSGRAGAAAVIMAVSTTVEIGGLAVLGFGLDLGATALPLATGLNGLVAGAYGTVALARRGLLKEWGWRPEALKVLLNAGLPVSLLNLVMFGMNFAFVMMLTPFGPDVVTGFATATTVQNLVIMPAMVLGSASAILMNQRLGAGGGARLTPVLTAALQITALVYAVIVPILWLLRGVLGHLTAESDRVAHETAHYIAIVGPSYLALGLVITALMALEQTGGALVSLAGGVIYVFGSVAFGALASSGASGPTPLYLTMSAMNACGVLAMIAALAYTRRQDGRRRTRGPDPVQGAVAQPVAGLD
ncbi:MATE family efflux transporter [Actinomadura macra]|uniref:MATE family efflux transporter n=1 Tax=Actinomadura macra TaxID=46164 RepID=UPI00083744E4|nr:MATE family efflux transporter [Actinomadura macra]